MTSRPSADVDRSCSTSTTRRCATAPSRRASPSRSTTSWRSPRHLDDARASASSRAAGRAPTPRTPSSSGRARTELDLEHAQLAAFGATRRPGAKAADDPQVAALRDSGAPVVTLVAKSHARHVELALRTTLDGEPRDGARHGGAPARRGPAGLPRRRALLRRLPQQPGVRPRGAPGRGRGGRRRRGALRHQRRAAARRGRRRRARGARGDQCPARHPLPQRRRLRGRQLARGRRRRRDPRAGHAQRLRRAHRQRRPPHRRRQPASSSGPGWCCPRAGCGRRPGSRTRSASSPTCRPTAASRTSGRPPFAHKAGLHASAVRVDPMLYQHDDPESVGNDMRMLVSDMAGRAIDRAQGSRAGLRPVRRHASCSAGSPTGSRRWRRAATPSRPPTRPSSCCCARRSRAPGRTSSRSSRGGSSSTRTATRTPTAARRPRPP